MKLYRWAMAGATAYVVYKYSIGKTVKGERVFDAPEPSPPADDEPTGDPKVAKPAV